VIIPITPSNIATFLQSPPVKAKTNAANNPKERVIDINAKFCCAAANRQRAPTVVVVNLKIVSDDVRYVLSDNISCNAGLKE